MWPACIWHVGGDLSMWVVPLEAGWEKAGGMQFWEKCDEVYFGHVESEMPIGHPKWRCQVGRWLFKCEVQKKGLGSWSDSWESWVMIFRAMRVCGVTLGRSSGRELVWPLSSKTPNTWEVFSVELCLSQERYIGPGWCGSVDWVLACEPKGHQFDSQLGHMPGLQARSPMGGAWEATMHWCFSPFLSPSFPLSKNN